MTKPPTLCWRGSDADVEPVPCECETFGHPNRTTAGETMYANSHFRTREEAWESIEGSVRAGLTLSASRVEEARRELAKAERQLLDHGMRAAAFGRKRWP